MNNARIVMVIMSVLTFLFTGCGRRPENKLEQTGPDSAASVQLEKPPDITSESSEGFHDLVFYIQDFKQLPDGTQVLRIAGIFKNQKVGLDIILNPPWEKGSLGKDVDLVIFKGSVTYRSIGSESDTLLQAMDELYGTKVNPGVMKTEIHFSAITLGGKPDDLAKGPVKIKLFYEAGGDDAYAELYINIELGAHKLHIDEKDESYRSEIVKALKAP